MNDRLQKEREYTLENYTRVEKELISLEELIKNKFTKEKIQERYKEIKEWFKSEYKKVDKYKSQGGYISRLYHPMIRDIFVVSFDRAKTNSSVNSINEALIDAQDYFNHWNCSLTSCEKDLK